MQLKLKIREKKHGSLSSWNRMTGQAAQNFFSLLHARKEGNTKYHMGFFHDYPDLLWVNKFYTKTIKANHEDEGQIFKMMHGFLLQSCLEVS